jgi:rod shape-determining protein MreD
VIRDAALLLLGFLLLVVESAIGGVTGIGPWMPNAVLPMVLYLGITPELPLWRAALLAALLGVLVDSAMGNSIGIMTFVHVTALVAARAASLRLMMRGRLSQAALTALMSALAALLVVALRSLFRSNSQVPATSVRHGLVAVLLPSLTTGLIAPFVFQLVRRVDARSRRDESASLATGRTRRAGSET